MKEVEQLLHRIASTRETYVQTTGHDPKEIQLHPKLEKLLYGMNSYMGSIQGMKVVINSKMREDNIILR